MLKRKTKVRSRSIINERLIKADVRSSRDEMFNAYLNAAFKTSKKYKKSDKLFREETERLKHSYVN